MRLHEYYFENLGGKTPLDKYGALGKQMQCDFGSVEEWEKDFRATGAMRGIGWAVLYQDNLSQRLFNFWINEHDAGHPAGCVPILIMDVFEHAFMIDYGLKRADYIESFFKNIDWKAAEARMLKKAMPVIERAGADLIKNPWSLPKGIRGIIAGSYSSSRNFCTYR